MAQPDYLICLDCDSPCYTFDWDGERGVDAICEACGNDDPDLFLTEEQLDSLAEEAESRR